MRKSEEMLFALLRASLHEQETETNFFVNTTETDWDECFKLAKKQGVMALAWDGVLRLPTPLHPDMELKLQWGIKVERIERKYQRYCKVAHEITLLYKQHDIATLHLKGVGLSTLYPVPSHREGGDIDIYTYSASKNLSDQEANALADTLIQQQGIEVEHHSYKHSNFFYKGIPVENHKIFLNVKDIKEAIQANEILFRELNPHCVELPAGKVQIPSPAFNTLFIAFHAMQHYGSGIALHHLCDWAVILKQYGLVIPKEMERLRFYQGIKALIRLCNDYLGTNVPVEGGEALANEMMQEILHPKYNAVVPTKRKVGIILYKTRRLLHTHKLKSRVFDISLSRRIWSSIVIHIRKPQTIFGRNEK